MHGALSLGEVPHANELVALWTVVLHVFERFDTEWDEADAQPEEWEAEPEADNQAMRINEVVERL